MASRNIKLVLEYDGSDYHGWQLQPGCRTIQAELQRALRQLLQRRHDVIASGRTDAGVHALGQVVNFRSGTALELNSIQKGVNSYLPAEIRVLTAEEVSESFHARYDAKSRLYRYVISKRLKAVGRQYCWFCKYDLSLDQIKTASDYLIGSKAFIAFSRKNDEEPHYLCDVHRIQWYENSDELIMEILANRFLHHMVRLIVGTLVEVGRGKLSPADVRDILEDGDRKRVGAAVPPQGLFLVDVIY